MPNESIETSDFTIAWLTTYFHNGNPVYYDDENYWSVNSKGFINMIDEKEINRR